MPFGRGVILPPGLGWYRDKISTGGKQKLGPISKQGDRYLRRILVVGAHSVLRRAKQNPEKYPWLTQLLARRHTWLHPNDFAQTSDSFPLHGGRRPYMTPCGRKRPG
jgi:transposase